MRNLLLAFVLAAAAVPVRGQPATFSTDSAYAALRVLAGDIGPRTMGSPAEQRALAYAAAMFARYGCDTAYVMPIAVARGINTSSGVAVGVKKGRTGRIIVIGGHIDSAAPEIPGACDDGSGSACVIECARVLNSRPHTSTYVFCCFGGEEEGLQGSTYFVEHFPLIDSVNLMLQADMADGAGYLEAYVDGPNQISAPVWLTRAAYEVYYHDLQYKDLIYNTHFSSINSSGEGASGSDHNEFLEKGIPAAAFVSDVSHPIHTPQDDLEHFTRSGLQRTGNLIIGLAERFDAGIPSRTTGTYYLVQFGTVPLFFSHTVLWAFVGVAVGLALVALWFARARRIRLEPRIRWSGIKILALVLIVQTAIWSSESIVGQLAGLKFPWVNRFGWYLVLALICGMLGIWAGTVLVRRFRLTQEAYGFYARSISLLLVFLLPLVFLNPEVALYPAWGLFWIGAAILVRPAWLKLAFVFVAPYYVLRVIFMEGMGFWQRVFTQIPLESFGASLLYNLAFAVIFALISLPFAYAFAGVYRESRVDYFWLRRWRFRWTGAVLMAVTALLVVILSLQGEGYGDTWRRGIRIDQRYVYGADSSDLRVRSSEFMDGVRLTVAGRDTTLVGRIMTHGPRQFPPITWLNVRAEEAHDTRDSTDRVVRTLDLASGRRPYKVSLTYRSDTEFTLQTPYGTGARSRFSPDGPRRKTLEWYSYPPERLPVSVTLELRKGQVIREDLEVVYDTTAVPAAAQGTWINVMRRTTVARADTLTGR